MRKDCFQDRLLESFQRHRQNIAVVFGEEEISYRALIKRADSITGALVNNKIKKETFVGIYTANPIDFISTMIGILNAGCVFVPLDVGLPPGRIVTMIRTTHTRIIFCQQDNKLELHRITGIGEHLQLIVIDDMFYRSAEPFSLVKDNIKYNPEDKIYIYFTSGTTGTPKAILGKNKSLLHFIDWEIDTFGIDENFRVSQFTSVGFDAFLRDLFVPLCSGGCVCIPAAKEILGNSHDLSHWIDKNQVNLIHCVPGVFRVFNADGSLTSGSYRTLKYVMLSGEKLTPLELKKWYERFGERIRLVNLYGPTETTMIKTFYFIRKKDAEIGKIPIGMPMKGSRVMILDKNRNLCGKGIVGEIYIRTPYMTFGYYNEPNLNKERFIPNPFTHDPGDLFYKTGDLGRILPDDNIELIGRIDRQIKIRGVRVELAEIETVMRNHLPVDEVIIKAWETGDGERYLCAYYVSKQELDPYETRRHLSRELPDYMIPLYFTHLDRISLTPNGKINMKALPEPGGNAGDEDTSTKDNLEEKLVDIFSEVLPAQKNKIGRDSNFFRIGGNSLKATELAAKVHKEINVKLPLPEIFKLQTIRGLSAYIRNTTADKHIPIAAVEKKEYYVLTSAQKRLYFLQQMEMENTGYNMLQVVELAGPVEKDGLGESFRHLVIIHESLRTSFFMHESGPYQRVHNVDEAPLSVEYYDLTTNRGQVVNNHNLQEKETHFIPLEAQVVKSFIRPFALGKAPLLRVGLIKKGEETHVLMVDMHHIISDGVSQSIIVKDFAAIHRGKTLPSLKFQYKDFAEWYRSDLFRESIKKQEKYRLNEFLGEIPVLNLPGDYVRPTIQSFEGSTLHFKLTDEDIRALKVLALEKGVTPYMLLLALYNILLFKVSGQEDIVVGTPTAGRLNADLEQIVGMFVNTLALRNFPAGYKTFSEFLAEVKKNTLGAFENQDYPFEELVDKTAVNRDPSRNPIFDVMFLYHNMEVQEIEIPGLILLPYNYERDISKFDLTLMVIEAKENLVFTIEYCTRLFKKETISKFITYFKQIVSSVLNNNEKKISGIDFIPDEEKQQILFDFNNTHREFPGAKTIRQLVEEQAAEIPDRVSVVGIMQLAADMGTPPWSIGEEKTGETVQLTYKELQQTSGQLAYLLREKGVQPDTIVGIMVERSIEMIIGILGILKAGGAYLPIEPGYPGERIKYILADSKAKILLAEPATQVKVEFKVEEEPIEIIDISYLSINSTSPSTMDFSSSTLTSTLQIGSANLAYIIYTSGSTGKSKGVMIEHGAILNTLFALQKSYPVAREDVYLFKTSYVFDVSLAELFGWGFEGGKLAILERNGEKDPETILAHIERYGITHINFVPSMFNAFVQLLNQKNIGKLSGVKYIFLAGEAILPTSIKKFRSLHSTCNVENIYGPTEAAIYGSRYSLEDWNGVAGIPIGKPLYNVKLYIIDKNNCLQPVGIPGELCISGPGLARGYLNQPELAIEKIVMNYFDSLTRLYRTGDLARWLSDGNIQFLGRIDQQVKIRGFRIEPGEIEYHLLNHPHIKDAVVVTRENKPGDRYLCAYLVPAANNGSIDLSAVKEYLVTRLPYYMVPSRFAELEKLPLTASGKIDLKSLPQPDTKGKQTYEAPANEIQQVLVEIWQDILEVEPIGINDNFFENGGDSIKAIQAAARLKAYKLEYKLTDLFLHPTINALEKYVITTDRVIDQGLVEGEVELTPIQQWFFENNYTNSHHFNQSVMIYSENGFDENIVARVLAKIVEHHDALRMVFESEENNMIQRNRGIENKLFYLAITDLRDTTDIEAEIEREVKQIQGGIALNTGPLVRVGLFKRKRGDQLFVVIHHLVVDAVSWRILLEDFAAGYSQAERGEVIKFPEKTDSFQYWSYKLREYAESKAVLNELAYWQALEEEKAVRLPRDREISNEEKKYKYTDTITVDFNEESTGKILKKVNQAYGTEINDILLTALSLALKDWAGIEKVLINLEGHGREGIIEGIDISRTVGWFTSQFPVLLNLSPAKNLEHLVKSVKETMRRIPNKGIGYGILKYLLPMERKKGLRLTFRFEPEINFNYLGQFDRENKTKMFEISEMKGGDVVSPELEWKYAVDISGKVAGGKLVLSFLYNRLEYNGANMAKLAQCYQVSLMNIIEHCTEKEEKVLTPIDLGYPDLTINELDALENIIEEEIF